MQLAAATKMILTPVMTLESHKDRVLSMSYFPDDKRMVSGSWDKIVRQWALGSAVHLQRSTKDLLL